MAAQHEWQGQSGGGYTYYVYPIGEDMADKKGNYIYAKRNTYGSWVPVYIGRGNLQDRSDLDSHHKGGCIRRNGATHFYAHLSAHKSTRIAEEQDLVAKWQPTCND